MKKISIFKLKGFDYDRDKIVKYKIAAMSFEEAYNIAQEIVGYRFWIDSLVDTGKYVFVREEKKNVESNRV